MMLKTGLFSEWFSQHSPELSQTQCLTVELFGRFSVINSQSQSHSHNRRILSTHHPDFFDSVGLNVLRGLGLLPLAISPHSPTPLQGREGKGRVRDTD